MKTEKNNYESPSLELTLFDKQDLLGTSGENGSGLDLPTDSSFSINP